MSYPQEIPMSMGMGNDSDMYPGYGYPQVHPFAQYYDLLFAGDKGFFPFSVYDALMYTVIGCGIVGNTCLFALMQHKNFKTLSYSVYLRGISVFDTVYLITMAFSNVDELNRELMKVPTLFCLMGFLEAFSSRSSIWFLVALTLDRFVIVLFPLWRKTLCTLDSALKIVLGISLFWVVFSVLSTIGQSAIMLCYVSGVQGWAVISWPFSVVMIAGVPWTLLCVMNFTIIFIISRSSKFRKEFTQGETKKTHKTENKTTVSLVTISLIGFLTITPMLINEAIVMPMYENYMVSVSSFFQGGGSNGSKFPMPPFWYHNYLSMINIFLLTHAANFAINFYLLMFTNINYRRTFASFFKCLRKSKTDVTNKERVHPMA